MAAAACDQISTRADQLGKLVEESMKQIGGADGADPLTAAPVEARALSGVLQAPVEVQAVSLDEMLSTQSFFVVGSVIAKPRVDMVEPVVDEDLEEAAAAVSEDVAAAASEEATIPESAELEPGPPPPPRPAPVVAAPAPGVIEPEISLKSAEGLRAPSAIEMRRSAQIAPKALREAVGDAQPISRDKLREARQLAEQRMRVESGNAQELGDQLARKAQDKAAPIARELAVRSKLNVDNALSARERAYSRLESMGLSGVVVPEEGGQMKIYIGADPTKFNPDADLTKTAALRQRFAKLKERKQDECTGAPPVSSCRPIRSSPPNAW